MSEQFNFKDAGGNSISVNPKEVLDALPERGRTEVKLIDGSVAYSDAPADEIKAWARVKSMDHNAAELSKLFRRKR